MANAIKQQFLDDLSRRFGSLRQLPSSRSLYVLGDDAARIYIRYSKLHARGKAFFGLRKVDLQQLEGHNSFVCYLLDKGTPPILVPHGDFEEVFHLAEPASDGQYKVQLILLAESRELYIARQGRFNVEGYVGFEPLERSLDASRLTQAFEMSHVQVQTLLASIGHAKGFDIYIPPRDAGNLDWNLTKRFEIRDSIPRGFDTVSGILSEVDVVWIASGRHDVQGMFEVEHSTPIYSGLLRFNDVLLTQPRLRRFVVVSNDARRELFVRQARRPTFVKSGLCDLASFLDYANVMAWHSRIGKEC